MSNIKEQEKLLGELKSIYHTQVGEKNKLLQDFKEKNKLIEVKIVRNEGIEYEKLILKKICEEARKESSEFFKRLTTSALQSVFGANTELLVNLNETKDPAGIDFLIKTIYDTYSTETDPADADGGGAADIVSLICFLTLNYLKRSENKASILLDEPTKFLSEGKSEKSGEFLKEMSQYLNRQIIMVTHQQTLKDIADIAYRLEINEKGYSEIVETIDNRGEDNE